MELLYVGRLDKEKGIDNMIFGIKKLIMHKYIFHINIYGSGQYNKEIKEISEKYPDFVTYHGRKNKKDIIGTWSESDFFIMPSTFLETFGLTACESLLCGVPVIGNKKGGLSQFIDNSLDIQKSRGVHDGERIFELISHIIKNKITKSNYKKIIKQTQLLYTIEKWKENISPYIYNQKKIGLISDFINYNGGGIETHINDIQYILKSKYHINLYGHQAPQGILIKIKKIRLMLGSFFNIYDSYGIYNFIKKNEIGLIWWHSISRVIGRLPLVLSSNSLQIITHHELGLFHPFPSKVTSEKQLPIAWSILSFIKAGETNNILKKILIMGKYIMIRMIHKQLKKKIKTHIVPSPWMIQMVRNRHPEANIICIPHFVNIK